MKKELIALGILGAAAIGGVALGPQNLERTEVATSTPQSIDRYIQSLPTEQKAAEKAKEIKKEVKPTKEKREKYTIEIIEVNEIEGGISVLARAWDKNGQIGFGPDGTVDIERFLIYNPPVLVADKNGDIIREFEDNGKQIRKLRYDPQEALLSVLEHTISVKKEKFGPEKITKGKIGNTTSTFFPAAGNNSPVDGVVQNQPSATTWATIRGGDGTGALTANENGTVAEFESTGSSGWTKLNRGIVLFDTSAIATGDAISSATLSIYGRSPKEDSFSDNSFTFNVFSSNPAANNALAGGDWDTLGTTPFATAISYASWNDTAYNDFSFNATGIAAIDKDGISKFGTMEATYDAPNSTPPDQSGAMHVRSYQADRTGTDNDPKLVVEHAAAVVNIFYPHSLF